MIRDLAPLLGTRLTFGVVPDWHGAWPLAEHREYCGLVQDSSEELLLHGYFHRRERGRGLASWLTGGADEMNGLDEAETRRTLESGQRVFTETFGNAASGFLAPAWQRGHVHATAARSAGIQHVFGFFSLDSGKGQRIPLTTWSWDCGRWRALGHVGHGFGRLMHLVNRGVPVLAIHPRDVERGFWPRIIQLTQELIDNGFEPTTPTRLLEARAC